MKIAVVGDVLLDVDIDGEATRLCPDAPVPVVDVSNVRRRAGGAGLVARMLAGDGHNVTLVTVLADDDAALHLGRALEGITVVAGSSGAPTPVKTRVRAEGHPVVRFDEACARPPVPPVTPAMLHALERAAVIVVADYGRGLTANQELRAVLAGLAQRVPIVWDPHRAGAEPVPGVAVVTPNLAEAKSLANAAGGPAAGSDGGGNAGSDADDELGAVAEALRLRWRSKAVMVTMGGQGALLVYDAGQPALPIPAPKTTVTDPCGAGDRLAASLAVHLIEGHTLDVAAVLAVREAAAFLRHGGVSALAGEPQPVKVHGRNTDALALARNVREAGGIVVATGGCFDLLHAGHTRALAAARNLGDCLIVCLNSDESVRRVKGPERPILNQEDRTELLLALEFVDAVLVFDEDTPEACLATLRPDLWVKGGDYDVTELPETGLVESWGGRCTTVPYHPSRSTTGLADALSRVS
ncbi:PfkB family carbohydrate kinase [Arthrobacter oryzae]|jgi:rfaE bifunctional protein nucleotidyltransferase chain/domain/rfaE bifunctional protein kinase chain/domain|uniref:PfkB family carbohydrate kinase n=1 Tax=Arthrobacter oryzae TaxID=409290 RepID=UPI0027879707|nr:PfkB family carbohydrate kinase [Arthrobacter oryzae]MDQ0076450.1 rfaE bifunctional protein nucleotidyltransferase chain/domain/rfaE bifunctional protein kinase chain/domain [Arthrobacter oryzae]